MKRIHLLLILLMLALLAIPFRGQVRGMVTGRKSVEDRVRQYGKEARARLTPHFAEAGVPYPPARIILVGIKDEKALHLYAAKNDGIPRLIRTYPILAASGSLGPKLREGDGQVPEGVYRIESLNPNSQFHELSLRVNYPNAFDRKMAAQDGREELGGDIMIHGGDCSVGCLAIGDKPAEELFILAADTGINNISVILSPVDFRKQVNAPPSSLSWVEELYRNIARELHKLPLS